VTAHPEGLVPLRAAEVADAEGLNAPAGTPCTTDRARRCRSAGVLRPWHAGREASKHWGSPIRAWDTRQAAEYCHRESPPDADGASYDAEYSARGKATDMGKDVTEVRRLPRQLRPDTVGSDPHQPTALRAIANKARVNKPDRFRDLDRCLNVELLMHCGHDRNKDAASAGLLL
jgi:hypothetical protein